MNSQTDPTPSDCPSDDQLSQFLKGSLQGEAKSKIAMHVSACLDCQKWIAGMKNLDLRTGNTSAVRISALFWIVPVSIVVLMVLGLIAFSIFFPNADPQMQLPVEETPKWTLVNSGRIVPDRAVEPGRVFPFYAEREEICIEVNYSESKSMFLVTVDASGKVRKLFPDPSNTQMRQNPVPAGRQFLPYDNPRKGIVLMDKKGVYFVVLIVSAQELAVEKQDSILKTIEELAKKHKSFSLKSQLEGALWNSSWQHQVLGVEVGS